MKVKTVAACASVIAVTFFAATAALGQHRVVLSNREVTLGLIPFEAGDAVSVVISPDGRRGLYVAPAPEGSEGVVAVIDGLRVGPYQEIDRDGIRFSRDGSRLAYAAKLDGAWCVVEEKDRGDPYDRVIGSSIRFSPDGKRLAYVASRGGKWFVVDEAQDGPAVDEVIDGRLTFSPDGARLAYAVRRDGRTFVLLDGNAGPHVDGASRPVFSADGARLAYAATLGGESMVVLDNAKLLSRWKEVRPLTLTLAADGTRSAYAVRTDAGMQVVLDEKPGEAFEWVFDGSLTFSPDGKRLAYAVKSAGGQCQVILDGKPAGPRAFSGVAPRSLTFSADGRRLAFVAERGTDAGAVERFVVTDGKEGRAFERVRSRLQFSPDGRHVAYVAERRIPLTRVLGGGMGLFQSVVVDDAVGSPYDCIRGDPVFSPDGKVVAVMAVKLGGHFEAGEETPEELVEEVGFRRLTFDVPPERRVGGSPTPQSLNVALVQEHVAER